MARKVLFYLAVAVFCLTLFMLQPKGSNAVGGEDMNPQKLVAAHAASIGSPALLAKVQSRTSVGSAEVNFRQGTTGFMKGTSVFVSQGPKLALRLQFQDLNYPGEHFAYDGKTTSFKTITPGVKSPIAHFLFRHDKIIKEGLFGGSMNSAWPLLDVSNKNADMKYRKTKIENIELYELEYHPRNGFGNMKIRMYFDMKTFQHVRTEYKVQERDDASNGNDGADPGSQVGTIGQARPDSFYTLIEKFEDYKKVGGLTLPHRYLLEYRVEGIGASFIGHWKIDIKTWAVNVPNLDPSFFLAEK
jgi:hypothetical protein